MNVHQSANYDWGKSSGSILPIALDLVVANQQFPEYNHLFTVLIQANDYNLKLIDKLIEIGELNRAKSYCIHLIDTNRIRRVSGYKERLKKLTFLMRKRLKLDTEFAQDLLHKLVFDDYMLVVSHAADEPDFREWRSKVLYKLSCRRYLDKKAVNLYFSVLVFEARWWTMLDCIDSYAGYATILTYAEILWEVFPQKFFSRLMNKEESEQDRSLRKKDPEKLREILEELFQFIVSKYDIDYLEMPFKKGKNRSKYTRNYFAAFLNEQLSVAMPGK